MEGIKLVEIESNPIGIFFSSDSNISLSECEIIVRFFILLEEAINFHFIGSAQEADPGTNISIKNCVIIDSLGIRIKKMLNVSIFNLSIERSKSGEIFRRGFFVEDCGEVNITQSILKGFSNIISNTLAIKSSKSFLNLFLNKLKIENCHSMLSGGGILIEGLVNGTPIQSVFINNTSQESGGALYLNLQPVKD